MDAMKYLNSSVIYLALLVCASCGTKFVPEYIAERENFSTTTISNRKVSTRQYSTALPGSRILRETEVSFVPSFVYAPSFSTNATSVASGDGYGLFCEYQGQKPDEISGEIRYFEFRINRIEQEETSSGDAVDNLSALMGVRIAQPWQGAINTYYAFGGGYQLVDFTLEDDLVGAAGYLSVGLEILLGTAGVIILDAGGQYLWGTDEGTASYVVSVGLGLKL